MGTDASPCKTGFLTSEFLLTVLGVAALVVLVLADKVEGQWAALAIGAACLSYTGGRSLVKKGMVDGQAAVGNFRADLAELADDEHNEQWDTIEELEATVAALEAKLEQLEPKTGAETGGVPGTTGAVKAKPAAKKAPAKATR